MSPDAVTIHDLQGDPNPYAYVRGTPLMGVDPDGNCALIDDAIIFAVAFAVDATIQYAQNGRVDWSDATVSGLSAVASQYLPAPVVSAAAYAAKQWLNGERVTWSGLRNAAVSGAVTAGVSSVLPSSGYSAIDSPYKGAVSGTAAYVATSSFHGGPTWRGAANSAKWGAASGAANSGYSWAAGSIKRAAQNSGGRMGRSLRAGVEKLAGKVGKGTRMVLTWCMSLILAR